MSDDVLIFGIAVKQDAVRFLSWADVQGDPHPAEGEFRWYHFNRSSVQGEALLKAADLVPEILCNALYQKDSRPRAVIYDEGLGLNLRGLTADHDIGKAGLVSLNLFASAGIVVTTRAFRLQAAEALHKKLAKGYVPENTGDIVTFLARHTVHLIDPVVQQLEDEVDRLEDDMLDAMTPPPKLELGQFRRSLLSLRRYISPQREAVSNLLRLGEDLIDKQGMLEMREALDTIMRQSEYLDMIRERAVVIQEQIVELRSEAMNQRLFALAIISAIFLPLGFVTGLFGVNVGGMPGVDSSVAFAVLCAGMTGMVLALLYLFHKLDWF